MHMQSEAQLGECQSDKGESKGETSTPSKPDKHQQSSRKGHGLNKDSIPESVLLLCETLWFRRRGWFCS